MMNRTTVKIFLSCALLLSNEAVTAFMSISMADFGVRTRLSSSVTLLSNLGEYEESNVSLLSRQELFQQIIKKSSTMASALATTTMLNSPAPALADVTNKVASKAALRYIKRSIKEFEKLEFFAAMNEYSEMKQGLRSPALSEVRKNANVLIKGGEDSEEAENLIVAYNAFIKDIEKLDGDASLGYRGRKGVELLPSYTQALKDLNAFEEIAERATAIPIATPETEQ